MSAEARHTSEDGRAAATRSPSARGPAQTLLLFDIDGTLLRGGNLAHREALLAALATVHGVEAPDLYLRISPAGRTDGEIARAILRNAGVDAAQIDARANAVRRESCRIYAAVCERDISASVIDGIPELLEWLSLRDDVILSLVTGNYEPIARIKLARAGLGRWFADGQGAFGSDSEDRAALPEIARRRAGADGAPFAREHTIVIGDTPRDIACARVDGVRCIAVATGPFGSDALTGADHVARDAGELGESLRDSLQRSSHGSLS